MELSWDDLRLFAAAWEHGSFSAAATALRLGQATMSRRIAALEDDLGHVLFDRSRGGLRPTLAAQRLYPHVEAMTAAAHSARAEIEGFEVAPEGLVRIACPPGVAAHLLAPVLPVLMARHPKLRVELVVGHQTVDLSKRQADIALRGVRPTSGDLIMRRLPEVSLGAFAASSYLDRLPEHPTAADLDWLQWSDELAHLPMARWVEAIRGDREPVLTANSFLTLTAAAEHGMGCFVTTELQARISGLLPVPVDLPALPDAPWFIVCHKALRRVPRVRVVMDFIYDVVVEGTRSKCWPPTMG